MKKTNKQILIIKNKSIKLFKTSTASLLKLGITKCAANLLSVKNWLILPNYIYLKDCWCRKYEIHLFKTSNWMCWPVVEWSEVNK